MTNINIIHSNCTVYMQLMNILLLVLLKIHLVVFDHSDLLAT